MRSQTLLIVDVETVPDAELLPSPCPDNHFPKPIGHQVVAISYLEARSVCFDRGCRVIEARLCRSVGDPEHGEAELLTLLTRFWGRIGERRPRLVTWNGRGFDMPVLNQRALVHGLSIPGWHQSGDRFANYRYRYATDHHLDLMDVLGDHGAAVKLGLDEACRAVGLPGKFGGHGSEVGTMIAAGEIGQFRAYCEGDCLNTFGLALRYLLLCGELTAEGYDRSIDALTAFLERGRDTQPHFGIFLDRWRASQRPKPMHTGNWQTASEPIDEAANEAVDVKP